MDGVDNGLLIGQVVAFVLFVASEVLGNTDCDYNSVYEVVKKFLQLLFVKPIGIARNGNNR